MKYQPGWGINLSGWRWHRIDLTKLPAGQVSFCGVGICAPEHLGPYPGDGRLRDLLSGKLDAPVCKKCGP